MLRWLSRGCLYQLTHRALPFGACSFRHASVAAGATPIAFPKLEAGAKMQHYLRPLCLCISVVLPQWCDTQCSVVFIDAVETKSVNRTSLRFLVTEESPLLSSTVGQVVEIGNILDLKFNFQSDSILCVTSNIPGPISAQLKQQHSKQQLLHVVVPPDRPNAFKLEKSNSISTEEFASDRIEKLRARFISLAKKQSARSWLELLRSENPSLSSGEGIQIVGSDMHLNTRVAPPAGQDLLTQSFAAAVRNCDQTFLICNYDMGRILETNQDVQFMHAIVLKKSTLFVCPPDQNPAPYTRSCVGRTLPHFLLSLKKDAKQQATTPVGLVKYWAWHGVDSELIASITKVTSPESKDKKIQNTDPQPTVRFEVLSEAVPDMYVIAVSLNHTTQSDAGRWTLDTSLLFPLDSINRNTESWKDLRMISNVNRQFPSLTNCCEFVRNTIGSHVKHLPRKGKKVRLSFVLVQPEHAQPLRYIFNQLNIPPPLSLEETTEIMCFPALEFCGSLPQTALMLLTPPVNNVMSFAGHWQRLVGDLDRAILRQHLLSMKPTEFAVESSPYFLERFERTQSVPNNLRAHIQMIHSPFNATQEKILADEHLSHFVVVSPGSDSSLETMTVCEQSSQPVKVVVFYDAKTELAALFGRGEGSDILDFVKQGGQIWCLLYAQHLISGFTTSGRETLNQLNQIYYTEYGHAQRGVAPPSTASRTSQMIETVFRGQVTLAREMMQCRVISQRVHMITAAVCIELNGLKTAPSSDIVTNAIAARDVAVMQLRQYLPTHVPVAVKDAWNWRSGSDIAVFLFGGNMMRTGSLNMVAQVNGTGGKVSRPSSLYRVLQMLHCAPRVSAVAPPPHKTCVIGPDPYLPDPINRGQRTIISLSDLVDRSFFVSIKLSISAGNIFSVSIYFIDSDTALKCNVVTDKCVASGDVGARTLTLVLLDLQNRPEVISLHQRMQKIGDIEIVCIAPEQQHSILCSSGILHALVKKKDSPSASLSVIQWFEKSPVVDSKLTVVSTAPLRDAKSVVRESTSFADDFADLASPRHSDEAAKSQWLSLFDIDSHASVLEKKREMMISLGLRMGTREDGFATQLSDPMLPHPQLTCDFPGMFSHMQQSERELFLSLARGANGSVSIDAACLQQISAKMVSRRTQEARVLFSDAVKMDQNVIDAVDLISKVRFLEKMQAAAALYASHTNHANFIHGSLMFFSTTTGRLSSERPNIQNIPKDLMIRNLFVSRFGPRTGRMMEIDYTQLEVMILAVLARDSQMKKDIINNVDFHCVRVGLMTGIPYEDVIHKIRVEKDPALILTRQRAKVFSFQRQYGASIATVAESSGLSIDEITKLIKLEAEKFPGLPDLYALVKYSAKNAKDATHSVRGRASPGSGAPISPTVKRIMQSVEPELFFTVDTGTKFSFSHTSTNPHFMNYPIQGFASEVVQVMVGRLNKVFMRTNNFGGKAFLVNTVHDSVWIDLEIDVLDDVVKVAKELMEAMPREMDAMWPTLGMRSIPMPVTIKVGHGLGDLEDFVVR